MARCLANLLSLSPGVPWSQSTREVGGEQADQDTLGAEASMQKQRQLKISPNIVGGRSVVFVPKETKRDKVNC